ncbi:uncharacterized protein LOC119180070 isoform X7 [Rhipicephalus microplus]|uniref:uncharacterized protein LOC119180070 isoform X7 n=1 Tax=Rhipicephalus microplus TaxID=6941 RepID=UPI003F6CCB7B
MTDESTKKITASSAEAYSQNHRYLSNCVNLGSFLVTVMLITYLEQCSTTQSATPQSQKERMVASVNVTVELIQSAASGCEHASCSREALGGTKWKRRQTSTCC